jgi:hypothetical protein
VRRPQSIFKCAANTNRVVREPVFIGWGYYFDDYFDAFNLELASIKQGVVDR